MFEHIPTYDKYRTLEQKTPAMRGEDVYALQTALDECSFECGSPDGVFGPMADRAVREAQRNFKLAVDGKAGGLTQKALAIRLAISIAALKKVPPEALEGQLEHESGFRLGIYSPERADGSYDAGVAQRNTNFTSPKEGFDPAPSIRVLAENTRKHFLMFEGVRPQRRRWALAQGAWNAPAFACYIAKEEGANGVRASQTLRPSAASRETLEKYIKTVSKYLPITL